MKPIQRAIFSLGTFGSAAPGVITVQLQLYFSKLGYAASIIGNVKGISIFLDAFADPIMGYISDRTASRFGRRMPYIATGAMVMAAGLIGMWLAPAGLSDLQFYAYLIAMQLLFTIGTTMTGVPYSALIPELEQDYQRRTTLVSWMQAGNNLGAILGGGVAVYSRWRGDMASGFRQFAIACSVLMVLCYWTVVLCIREPQTSAASLDEGSETRPRPRALGAYLLEHLRHIGRSLTYALSDRRYLILFFTVFIYQAGILAGMWMYTYLLNDWFGGSWTGPFAERWLTGPLYIFRDAFFLFIFFGIGCGTLFLPFWNGMGKRFEKRTCMLVGILGVGLTYGASYLLFAPKSFPLFIVYCVVLSFFYCAVNVMPTSMLADVATNSELERSEANEGMFFGANSFLTKVYNAAAQVWTGFALERIVHYQAGAHAVQTPEALHRMRLLYAIPPVITAIIAIVVLMRYDLTRAKMTDVSRQIAVRRRRSG